MVVPEGDSAIYPVDAVDAVDVVDAMDTPKDPVQVEKEEAKQDFDDFKELAQSVEVPKETKEGNIVLAAEPEIEEAEEVPTENLPELAEEPEPEEAKRPHQFVTTKDFDLLKVIGMGAFGKVLQVRHKHTQRILAMKVISKRLLRRKSGYVENIQAERKILTRVRSPFVVTMHCSFQTREKLFIIMDFLAGGELFLRLGREGIFLEKTAAFYVAEIILALEHLHSLGILHRDLKPENILLASDGHVQVTDFGLAKDVSDSGGFEDEDNKALTICGTQEYMSPEMLSRQGYGRAADYWSLGCITYEMLKGLPPFSSKQGAKELFRKIMSEKVKMPPGTSAAGCKLLKGLLCRNVQKRLGTTRSTMFEVGGVAALKNMEFFESIDWQKLEERAVEPPHVLHVEDDHDLKHFHGEFTDMPLPRSVVLMSKDDFQPRRVQSENFRGFSFIQKDFELPDRDQMELEEYWNSTEADALSLSECASSKFGVEEEEPAEPEKKKRPPRKRKKKKKADAASTDTTPVPSTTNTPVPSNDNTPAVTPTPSENGDAKVDDGNKLAEKKDTARECDISNPSPVAPQPAPAAPPKKPAKPKQEVWQSASTKKKNPSRAGAVQKQARGVRAPQGRYVPGQQQQQQYQPRRWGNAPPGQQQKGGPNGNRPPPPAFRTEAQARSSTATRPTPWSRAGQQQQLQRGPPVGGNQGMQPAAASRPTSWSQAGQQQRGSGGWASSGGRQQPVAPASPSSDWRQHSMSPRSAKRTLRQPKGEPSWPSLANDPPLNPRAPAKPVAKPNLQGAWATRTKS